MNDDDDDGDDDDDDDDDDDVIRGRFGKPRTPNPQPPNLEPQTPNPRLGAIGFRSFEIGFRIFWVKVRNPKPPTPWGVPLLPPNPQRAKGPTKG